MGAADAIGQKLKEDKALDLCACGSRSHPFGSAKLKVLFAHHVAIPRVSAVDQL